MKKKSLFIVAGLIIVITAAVFVLRRPKLVEKPYFKMSLADIDLDIRAVNASRMSIPEKMTYYSERFLGAPYDLYCEGDGEYAKYETMPLMNFKKLNCMTYCEIVMALSLSDYYEDMFNVLQHIRYRQGIIGMATRNHYTMVDWLPENAWCLDDISRLAGGEDTQQLTRTISHKTFFAGKGIQDIPLMFPDREVTIDYIPLDKLPAHEDSLRSGDVVALIMDAQAIFSGHMLMIVRKQGNTYFRHASMSAGKVIDSPFTAYINGLARNPKWLGMSFMRMKNKIKWQDGSYTHGKFILPDSTRMQASVAP